MAIMCRNCKQQATEDIQIKKKLSKIRNKMCLKMNLIEANGEKT